MIRTVRTRQNPPTLNVRNFPSPAISTKIREEKCMSDDEHQEAHWKKFLPSNYEQLTEAQQGGWKGWAMRLAQLERIRQKTVRVEHEYFAEREGTICD